VREIIRVINRLLRKLIGLDLIAGKDRDGSDSRAVDEMKSALAALKASAGQMTACQYRIERSLAEEQQRLARLQAEAAESELDEAPEVDSLRTRAQECRTRVEELGAELECARREATEARRQLELFRDRLREAESRARDARARLQLAAMQTQLETAALDASLEKELAELERIEGKANSAKAEAEAIAELNQALGRTPPPRRIDGPEGGSGQ